MELVTGHAGTLHITAKQVSRLLRGVTATDESTVQRLNVGNNAAITYSGITMSIASGELLLDGYHVTLVDDTGGASGETLIFDATLESTNSRIDKVVLEIVQDNTTSYQRAEIVIVQGEESASPVAPATPTEPESSTEEFLAVGVIAQVTITGDDISSLSDLTNLYGGNYVEYTKFEDTISDLVNVYGAKNLIPYPYYHTSGRVNRGVTFTYSDDGIIYLNGTPDGNGQPFLNLTSSRQSSQMTIRSGTEYILSCESDSNYGFSALYFMNEDLSEKSVQYTYEYDDGTTGTDTQVYVSLLRSGVYHKWVKFNLMEDVSHYQIDARYTANTSITADNVYEKIMLRMASIEDDTYEPYAMTNQELTKNVQDIENDISETQDIISDAWSNSKTYAADEYCISGNRLYKCLVANTGMQPPNTTYWEETTCAEELGKLNSNLTNKQATIKYVQCYKDASQTNSAYTYGSGGLYRINVGAISSFTNYPTGKTILATIPMGGHNDGDPSFAAVYDATTGWGVVAHVNTKYRFVAIVLYID